MFEIRYFTKADLLEANNEAIASNRNRTLIPEMVEALPDKNFPVAFFFIHNDVEMRCRLILSEIDTWAFLDVPLATYNSLPTAIVHDDGSVEFSGLTTYQVESEVESKIETVQVYKCMECEEISEDAGDQLYECGNCGIMFIRGNSADGASHRCPDCNKFSSKVADRSCVDCEEGEVEEITGYKCPSCETVHEDKDEARNCCQRELV